MSYTTHLIRHLSYCPLHRKKYYNFDLPINIKISVASVLQVATTDLEGSHGHNKSELRFREEYK